MASTFVSVLTMDDLFTTLIRNDNCHLVWLKETCYITVFLTVNVSVYYKVVTNCSVQKESGSMLGLSSFIILTVFQIILMVMKG